MDFPTKPIIEGRIQAIVLIGELEIFKIFLVVVTKQDFHKNTNGANKTNLLNYTTGNGYTSTLPLVWTPNRYDPKVNILPPTFSITD